MHGDAMRGRGRGSGGPTRWDSPLTEASPPTRRDAEPTQAADRKPTNEEISELRRSLRGMTETVKDIFERLVRQAEKRGTQTYPIIATKLDAIYSKINEIAKKETTALTYAAITARGTQYTAPIQARQTPTPTHEVTIRMPADQDPDNRSYSEVVQAINNATKGTDARAARKLPSGDWKIAFNPVTAKARTIDDSWVTKVFQGGSISHRLYRVVAYAIRIKDVTQIGPEEFVKKLNRENPGTGAKSITIPKRNLEKDIGSIIISVDNIRTANILCDKGLFFDHGFYTCSPFCESASPRQCYKCQGFGHVSKHCVKKGKCAWCSSTRHTEAECELKKGKTGTRCANCSGNHAAFDPRCPEKAKHRESARIAFQNRPTRFIETDVSPTLEVAKETENPRKRGRPTREAAAQQAVASKGQRGTIAINKGFFGT